MRLANSYERHIKLANSKPQKNYSKAAVMQDLPSTPFLIGFQAAADYLGTTAAALRVATSEGRFDVPRTKISGCVVFTIEDLDNWKMERNAKAARRKVASTAAPTLTK